MTKLSTEQEPSGQTVREILVKVFKDGINQELPDYYKDTMTVFDAEAAINAHIVSVLEELNADIKRMQPDPDYYAQAIAATIAKYKQEDE